MQILQQLHEILGEPLRHEPDIEAYLRDSYPPSYREVMDAEQEMARSQHARTRVGPHRNGAGAFCLFLLVYYRRTAYFILLVYMQHI